MDTGIDLSVKALANAADLCPLGGNDCQPEEVTTCAKCHTPRQMRLEALEERRPVPVLCACRAEKPDAAQREGKRRKHPSRVLKWRGQGIPHPDEICYTVAAAGTAKARPRPDASGTKGWAVNGPDHIRRRYPDHGCR